MQDDFGLFQCLTAAAYAFDFNFIAALTEAGSIREHDGQAADIGSLFNCVPSCSRDRRDNGAVATQELVQEAGFSGVRTAYNRSANAPAQDLAFVGSAQQFVHEGDALHKPGDKLGFGFGGDVFVGEINVRFDVGERLEHFIAEVVDAA